MLEKPTSPHIGKIGGVSDLDEYKKNGIFLPGNVFWYKFFEQFDRPIKVKAEGYDEPVDDTERREDAPDFVAGIKVLLSRAQFVYDDYWGNLISATGNQTYRSKVLKTPFYTEKQKKALEDWEEAPISLADGETFETLNLALDLYACISVLKPDIIITLTNGALRLHSLCKAMGFDSDNFLSIHRELPTEYTYRKNLDEPIYDGKKIEPGSRVLILEDTSSLEGETTYGKARKWLEKMGVTDTPVFIEQMYQTIQRGGVRWNAVSEKYTEIQKKLNDDNCFNSYARYEADDHLHENIQTNISSLIQENPEVYDNFFGLIRKMGSETTKQG